jgi:hypothetical protein
MWAYGSIVQNSSNDQTIHESESNMPRQPLKWGDLIKVQCFPLYSILLAVGRTTIDFLSLDIEGGELDVLATIPWHKVNIKVKGFFIFYIENT